MKVVTGHYLINYFNRYGSRIKGLEEPAKNLMAARAQAANRLAEPSTDEQFKAVSFVIDRRIVNSLDKREQ